MCHGLLNLHKPAGMTSRRAVDLVQRLVRPLKAGHAGTLDPLATGVLVACVGRATRLIEHVQRMPKSYTGTFLLGRTSPTEDIEGEVTELPASPVPTHAELEAAARGFRGEIQQRPPAYSALKVEGRRAYDLARKGQSVKLQARPITIYALEIVRYAYPELVLHIECSSGTYVRSLGRDLAAALDTAAVMSALVRTAIGPFRVEQSVDPRELTAENWAAELQPMVRAVEDLPQVVLTAEEIVRVHHGQTIVSQSPMPMAAEIAALDATGRLVAILGPRSPGQFRPLRNFGT